MPFVLSAQSLQASSQSTCCDDANQKALFRPLCFSMLENMQAIVCVHLQALKCKTLPGQNS